MSPPTRAQDHRPWTQAAPWAMVLIVAVGVYANTLFHDFVWDDFYLIIEDHTIKSFDYLDVIFKSDFFGHQEDDLVYGYFRPLVSLSYALDYAIWQKNPFGYHLTNILLHGLATLLVAAVLIKMRINRSAAFAAALLFAVHPMHTENVAWISGRTDLIAFVLAMMAFIGYLTPRPAGRGLVIQGLSLTLFAAALMAKEMAVVVIVWMGIADAACHRRNLSHTARSLLPYGGVIAVYLIWRFFIADVPVPAQASDITVLQKIATAPWTITRYLAWLLLPISQSAYVQNPHVSGAGDIRLYIGVAVVAGFSYPVFRLRQNKGAALGLLSMLAVSFVPILNLIAIAAPRDMGHVMAERFLYFPSFPFLALVAVAADALWARLTEWPRRRLALTALLSLVVLAAAAATIARNRVWKNNEVFYRTTLEATPSALMWCNLAHHYIQEAKWQEAKEALDSAKKYFFDDYHYLSAMALWYVAQHRYNEAIALQEKVAAKVKRGRAVAYNNLAYLYRTTGNLKRARALLEEIIDNGRGYADVYFNLAEVYRATGMMTEAVDAYRQALSRRPDHLPMATALARALMQRGEWDEAVWVFEAQLEMHGQDPGLLNNLGVVYKKKNRLDRARELFEESIARDPSYVKARLNLAATLLALKRKQEAIAHLSRIIERHPTSPESRAARKLLADL